MTHVHRWISRQDPRGPLRTTMKVERDPDGGPVRLTLICGHVGECANHFSYKTGADHRCFTCGLLERVRWEAQDRYPERSVERQVAERKSRRDSLGDLAEDDTTLAAYDEAIATLVFERDVTMSGDLRWLDGRPVVTERNGLGEWRWLVEANDDEDDETRPGAAGFGSADEALAHAAAAVRLAHLHAAAPELLAALKACSQVLAIQTRRRDGGAGQQAFEKACAAIRKAEAWRGRSGSA